MSTRGPGNVSIWDWQHKIRADNCKRYVLVQVLDVPYGSQATIKQFVCSWTRGISIHMEHLTDLPLPWLLGSTLFQRVRVYGKQRVSSGLTQYSTNELRRKSCYKRWRRDGHVMWSGQRGFAYLKHAINFARNFLHKSFGRSMRSFEVKGVMRCISRDIASSFQSFKTSPLQLSHSWDKSQIDLCGSVHSCIFLFSLQILVL